MLFRSNLSFSALVVLGDPEQKVVGYGTGKAKEVPAAIKKGIESAKRNLRKAVMYPTVRYKGTVMEKFKAVREAGFEGVEPLGGMDRNEVIDALQASGLEAASVCCHTHWVKPLSAPDEATRVLASRARADETRHVHFGMSHVRHALAHDPALYGRLEAAVRRRAATLSDLAGVPVPLHDAQIGRAHV